MPTREYETIQTLKSELFALLERVQELDRKLQDYATQYPLPQELPETVLITVSYLLNGIYSCFEDQFLKIAKVFENRVENPAWWHRELLERMQIEVEGVRPRVLNRPAFRLLNELRGFRHVFRSSYAFELDEERVRLILRRWEKGKATIYKDIQSFIDKLTAMASGDV
jgi:ribonuclease HepT-like protein